MKVIVNKCYGGFGLSTKAELEYYKKQGEVYPFVVIFNDNFESSFERYDENKSYARLTSTVFFKKNPTTDTLYETWEEVDKKYEMVNYDLDKKRADEELIEIVERLGSAAYGSFAKLEVVEIPDGYDYEISDYDGVETIYYGKDLKVI